LHAEKGNHANALADLSSALEADEKNEAALVARSNLYARLAKWTEAAADSRKATELNPDSPRHWAATAILLARAGEAQQYHDHCEKMAEKFSAASDPKVAHMIARSALLMPEAVDVKLLPRRATEDAVAGFGSSPLSRAEGYTTLALLEVRANRPEEAFSLIRRAQEDPKYSKTPAVQAFSFLVQAMAEHAVGKRNIARESLKASKAFVGGIPPAAAGGDYAVNNELRLAIETLDAEVARVVK
jgi:tetratricopeptide (TPR) repeat protein